MPSIFTKSGLPVSRPPDLAVPPGSLTCVQVGRIRENDWRVAHDVGVLGPDDVVRTRSLRLIARLSGRSRGAVKAGIVRARALRKAIRDACAQALALDQ